jgi:hypothetical protein
MREAVFDNDEELLTVEELCEWLKVPKSWIYERVRTRKGLKLPAHQARALLAV